MVDAWALWAYAMNNRDTKDYNDLVDAMADLISSFKKRAEKAEAEIKLMEPVVNAAIRLVSPDVNRRYDPSYELKLLGLAVREYQMPDKAGNWIKSDAGQDELRTLFETTEKAKQELSEDTRVDVDSLNKPCSSTP